MVNRVIIKPIYKRNGTSEGTSTSGFYQGGAFEHDILSI